jgi:hypothetical protein
MGVIIKLNKTPMSEDELDVQAFERDVVLFDYLDRVEKGQLSDSEKKGREALYKAIGFGEKN